MRNTILKWLKRIRPYRLSILTALIILIVIFLPADFTTTKFKGRLVWDWMELLLIPLALALAALWFNRRENALEREIAAKQRETDLQIAREQRHEDILQNYFDKMTALMIEENWLAKAMTTVAGGAEG